jgi:hypothetical protein
MSAYDEYRTLLATTPSVDRPRVERAFEAGVVHAAETFQAYRELDREAAGEEVLLRRTAEGDEVCFRRIFGG